MYVTVKVNVKEIEHLLEGVKDYKITSSAEESTELVLIIDIPNIFTELETSAIQRKRTSLE